MTRGGGLRGLSAVVVLPSRPTIGQSSGRVLTSLSRGAEVEVRGGTTTPTTTSCCPSATSTHSIAGHERGGMGRKK